MKVEFSDEVKFLEKEKSRLVIALKHGVYSDRQIVAQLKEIKAITECLDFFKNFENENGGKKDGQMAASR